MVCVLYYHSGNGVSKLMGCVETSIIVSDVSGLSLTQIFLPLSVGIFGA
jgi:hypothetical protein